MTVIVIFYFLFFLVGVNFQGQGIALDLDKSVSKNLYYLTSCAYFSVITFTTLGYGDITPIGLSRFLTAVEALYGSFTLALFVVVFVKKMTS